MIPRARHMSNNKYHYFHVELVHHTIGW